jgi:hypothetical protein
MGHNEFVSNLSDDIGLLSNLGTLGFAQQWFHYLLLPYSSLNSRNPHALREQRTLWNHASSHEKLDATTYVSHYFERHMLIVESYKLFVPTKRDSAAMGYEPGRPHNGVCFELARARCVSS